MTPLRFTDDDTGGRGVVAFRCLAAAAMIVAAWWIYAPALHGGRQWDDNLEIFENPQVRAPFGFLTAWSSPAGADYLPLKTSIEWAMWRLWGDNVFGYHAAGVGLHLLGGMLLWWILRRLGIGLAWLGGMLFVAHPLAVDSVAWISELKNTLSLPPLLLAFGWYVRFAEKSARRPSCGSSGGGREYLLSLIAFVAALLCKSSGVMLPLVLVLYLWWRDGRLAVFHRKALAPFFAASLVLGLVTLHFQGARAIGELAPSTESFLERGFEAPVVAMFYGMKCVFPAALSPAYSPWLAGARILPAFGGWAALGVLAYWVWRRQATWGRGAGFATGCFLASVAPVAGLFPMSYFRISRVADHLGYLALASACGAVVAGIGLLVAGCEWRRKPTNRALQSSRLAGGLLALAALPLAMQARAYARVFRDPVALWTRAAVCSPDSWFAQNNLGSALLEKHEAAAALPHLEAAVRLAPAAAEAWVNLGDALLGMHRVAEAIDADESATRLEPGFGSAQYNLANALVAGGRLPEALQHYEVAVRLEPASAAIHYNYGTALAQADRLDDAIAQLSTAARLDPTVPETRINFANVLAAAGRMPEAAEQFAAALRLRPDDADANYGLADLLAATGRPSEALPHYEAALRARPDDGAIRASLAAARARAGR